MPKVVNLAQVTLCNKLPLEEQTLFRTHRGDFIIVVEQGPLSEMPCGRIVLARRLWGPDEDRVAFVLVHEIANQSNPEKCARLLGGLQLRTWALPEVPWPIGTVLDAPAPVAADSQTVKIELD